MLFWTNGVKFHHFGQVCYILKLVCIKGLTSLRQALTYFNFYLCLEAENVQMVKYGETLEMDCFEPDLANQDSQSYISLHVAMPNVKANAIVQYRVIKCFV